MTQVIDFPPTVSQASGEAKVIETAEGLMEQAWATSNTAQRVVLAQRALLLDPDCLDAVTVLATHAQYEDHVDPALQLELALDREKNRLERTGVYSNQMGSFWNTGQTRAYVRGLAALMRFFQRRKQTERAVGCCEELLALDKRDTQGIRYSLATLYIRTPSHSTPNSPPQGSRRFSSD